MRLDELIAEWINLGRQDISSAGFLMNMRPLPLEIIGFHCQQAVEKYLKAFLILHDQEPEKTHDLVYLLKACVIYDESFSDLGDACSQLTEYAVKSRYPYHGSIDADRIEKAFSLATDACAFIKSKIETKLA